jgi:starch phosphorylase
MSQSVRTGLTSEEIKQDFRENLRCGLGRLERFATKNDFYLALAIAVRNRLFERIVETMDAYGGVNARRVAYLSAEYLPGPHLANNLLNLGVTNVAREAFREREDYV